MGGVLFATFLLCIRSCSVGYESCVCVLNVCKCVYVCDICCDRTFAVPILYICLSLQKVTCVWVWCNIEIFARVVYNTNLCDVYAIGIRLFSFPSFVSFNSDTDKCLAFLND